MTPAEKTIKALITLLVAANGGNFVYTDDQLDDVETWPLTLYIEKNSHGAVLLSLGRK